MSTTVIDYDIELWPKQWKAIEHLSIDNPCEVLGYGGAKGGGKSHLSRAWLVARAIKYAGSSGLLIRESFPELERTHIKKMKQELPQAAYNYVERRHQFELPNGSMIEMAYAERPEDIETNYQGAEYDQIVIDEAQNHQKKTFQLLRGCLRTTRSDLRPKFLLTFNWGSKGHAWLKKMFWRKWMSTKALPEDINDTWESDSHWEFEIIGDRRVGEKPEDFVFLQAKVYDNPSIMINDPGYVERLEGLPKSLREAYLNGEPELLEGQFFVEFGSHLREKPFKLEESELRGRLFGSLDHGITHYTAFALYWLAGPRFAERFNRGKKWGVHRLFTYKANGGSTDIHARAIYEKIESFPFIKGVWPDVIVADPSMWTKSRYSEDKEPANIDFYEEVFSDRHTRFERANHDKKNGCQIMRTLYNSERDAPYYGYWDGFNADLEDDIVTLVFDKNDREIYQKADGDDIGDGERYGLMYGWRLISGQGDIQAQEQEIAQHNAQRAEMDWKVV